VSRVSLRAVLLAREIIQYTRTTVISVSYRTTQKAPLSQSRETARCFVSLNISLTHSRSFKITPLS